MRKIALLAALGTGLVAFLLLLRYQQSFEARVSGGSKVPLLVAASDIPLGAVVRREMLAVREVPGRYVDPRQIPAVEADRIIGIRSTMALESGESILWTDLATVADKGRVLSGLIKSGMRAVTVQIEHGSSLGGLLRPGDRVDLLMRANRDNSALVLPLLQNLLVLAVGRDLGSQSNLLQTVRGGSELTLSVTVRQAQALTLAQGEGSLSVSLRNPDDIVVHRDSPVTTPQDIHLADKREALQTRRRPTSAPAPQTREIERVD